MGALCSLLYPEDVRPTGPGSRTLCHREDCTCCGYSQRRLLTASRFGRFLMLHSDWNRLAAICSSSLGVISSCSSPGFVFLHML